MDQITNKFSLNRMVSACAVVLGVASIGTWVHAKPTQGKAAKPAVAQKVANKNTKKVGAEKDGKSNASKQSKGNNKEKNIALMGGKAGKATTSGQRKAVELAERQSGAGRVKHVSDRKQGTATDKDVPTNSAASRKLQRQIAELQAKGKGKGKTLTKAQKQQLAKLMAEAKQLEKTERQARINQARTQQRLVVVNRQAPQSAVAEESEEKIQIAQATATANAEVNVHAEGDSLSQKPQNFASSSSVDVSTSAMQEDLIALQIAKQETQQQPSQIDPLQALVNKVDAAPAIKTTDVASAAAPPVPAQSHIKQAVAEKTAAPLVAKVEGVQPVAPAVPPTIPAASPIVQVSLPSRTPLGRAPGLGDNTAEFGPALHSNVAFVMDQNTGQVLVNKNGNFVSPIASITKLMTAVITMDANLPMDEMITITDEDVDRLKGSRSRLAVGTTLSRQELLHLALMSSENRAAHALGRTYPGGLQAAIRAMNDRALMLGMRNTQYVEPTGLSSANRSSARDLALLVRAAYRYPLIRNYTTHPGAIFPVQGQMLQYNNTNRLIHSAAWDIGLQKTGYISEAGRCVVMQSNIQGRNVVIVLLDSAGTNRRAEDAEAIRYWVMRGGSGTTPRRGDGGQVIARANALVY